MKGTIEYRGLKARDSQRIVALYRATEGQIGQVRDDGVFCTWASYDMPDCAEGQYLAADDENRCFVAVDDE